MLDYKVMEHFKDLIKNHSFLITGGAGFIGSNLAETLVRYEAKTIKVLDNFATGRRENLIGLESYAGFELVTGDIRNLDTCKKVMEGIDFVSHQAALGSIPRSIDDPITSNDVNISGFLNILVAARDEGVKKVIYAASSSTYGDSKKLPKKEDEIGKPLSPYAITKYVNELYAQSFFSTYGLSSIGLRYFNIFGPKQDPNGAYAAVIPLFMQAALTQTSPLINGDGTQTRDFTYIDNAIEANIKAMFADINGHEVMNVACGNRVSLNELWTIITHISGCKLNPIYRDWRKGDVMDSLADISKAERLIGYQPVSLIEEGLRLTFQWYKDNG